MWTTDNSVLTDLISQQDEKLNLKHNLLTLSTANLSANGLIWEGLDLVWEQGFWQTASACSSDTALKLVQSVGSQPGLLKSVMVAVLTSSFWRAVWNISSSKGPRSCQNLGELHLIPVIRPSSFVLTLATVHLILCWPLERQYPPLRSVLWRRNSSFFWSIASFTLIQFLVLFSKLLID